MTSLRNSEASSKDGYLDAARECILDVGWRRTTLTEVARRAGVSRMTIYRTWSDMPSLLADLMTREWTAVMGGVSTPGEAAGELPGGSDPVTAIADGMVAACGALRANELFVRIVELDPELLLPYLLARRGRSQEAVAGVLAELIGAGQSAGAIRAGDPLTMARAIILTAHGHCLSVQTMVDDHVTETALDAELRTMIAAGLAP